MNATPDSDVALLPPLTGSPSSVEPKRIEGILIPADYSFAAVNEFVHDCEVSYEELQWAMLGMATERDNLVADVARWKKNIIPFLAVHAGTYGRDHYGEGCLHFTHYDMLAEAGGRMDDFKRCGEPSPENAGAEVPR